MPLQTIARFSKPEEAHLLRTRLEAGGVPALVRDEYTVQMNWFLSNAIGGVRVMVDQDDVPRAEEILNDEPGEPLEGDRPHCPSCLSDQTHPDEAPRRRSFLALLVAGFPLPVSRHRWKCGACGRRWNERSGRAG